MKYTAVIAAYSFLASGYLFASGYAQAQDVNSSTLEIAYLTNDSEYENSILKIRGGFAFGDRHYLLLGFSEFSESFTDYGVSGKYNETELTLGYKLGFGHYGASRSNRFYIEPSFSFGEASLTARDWYGSYSGKGSYNRFDLGFGMEGRKFAGLAYDVKVGRFGINDEFENTEGGFRIDGRLGYAFESGFELGGQYGYLRVDNTNQGINRFGAYIKYSIKNYFL